MALWSGRFTASANEFTQRFGASLPVDKRMYKQDIAGSKAHATMLSEQGIISHDDAEKICAGLDDIEREITKGMLPFDINDEDLHMSIEKQLIARIGEAGARLHTGRSRNDQVICDTRLYLKSSISNVMRANYQFSRVLEKLAHEKQHVIIPGYTHMQHAQPVYLAHHLLAYVWMLSRDFKRLHHSYEAADCNPLGAAALAGTTYPLDRQRTTDLLGFSAVCENSLDAVSDRDFVLDTLYACSVSAMHLSRLAEELIMWSTQEFGFIELSDTFSTGSSIMPQKKNPDFAELVRGKTGRTVGNLVSLLVTMKALPLAYNKDLQEDKQGVFDSLDTIYDCLTCMAGMISSMTIHEDAMERQAHTGHLAATDVADYLVKKGMAFRDAHRIVGHLVLLCEQRGCALTDLSLADFKAQSSLFEENVMHELDIPSIVRARNSRGGTGDKALAYQFNVVKDVLHQQEELLNALTRSVS